MAKVVGRSICYETIIMRELLRWMPRNTLALLLIGVCAAIEAAPLGTPGETALYEIDTSAPPVASVVKTLAVTLGTEQQWHGQSAQWLILRATKRSGDSLEAWLLCSDFPGAELDDAATSVLRYVLKQGDASPREYRHAVTDTAVLPVTGGWPDLLPRGVSAASGSTRADLFPETVAYLGHRYQRASQQQGEPPALPDDIRVVRLRPDVLVGLPINTREVDETRRYDESEYDYIPLEREDYEGLIAAGFNCFRVTAENSAWFDEQGVFYWGVGGDDVAYPDCLYQPQYLGPALYFDEPAVVTRDSMIRPRLRKDPSFRRAITPQLALEAFEEHYGHVVREGAATQMLARLAARDDVDLGTMQFGQANIYSWETMVSGAAYELLQDPTIPGAIVFEPPGELGTRRTLPLMNMCYGCQIPVTSSEHFIDIIIGFLRGAARASDKQWGISIYGGVDPADAPAFFSRAYDLGATHFFFWNSARLACVPHGEVLALGKYLTTHAKYYPDRDLDRLRDAAEVAILLPPGYNLGHVKMGRGLLWGVGELNLERRNRVGVPYRTVMGNFFTEIERCLREGVGFDLLWDLLEVELAGYREIVRIREDGQVELVQDSGTSLLDGPRTPARPEGAAPRLSVDLSASVADAPATITASAHVVAGAAPVYYTPGPDDHGIQHNMRVMWELYGPGDEDYKFQQLTAKPVTVRPHPDGGHVVTAVIPIAAPGHYRLRAATTDLDGRSTVVWKDLDVRDAGSG